MWQPSLEICMVSDRQLGKMFDENGRFLEKLQVGSILILTPRIFKSIGITIEPAMFPNGQVDFGRSFSIRSKGDSVTIKKGMAVMFLKATEVKERDEWAVEVLYDNRICMFWAADAKMKVAFAPSAQPTASSTKSETE